MEPRDFSSRKYFPGTPGNPAGFLIHKFVVVQKIPNIVFAAILFCFAVIPTYPDIRHTVGFWLFLSGDWLLLAMLPKAGISYGPAKPSVLLLALFRILFAFLPLPYSLVLQVVGTLLVIYGFWIEPNRLTVSRYTLRSSKLPTNFNLRILHLGDLHVEKITRRERHLHELILSLKPDLILFSGDLLNLSFLDDPEAKEALRNLLSSWIAPLGAYAVPGSPAVDNPEQVCDLLSSTPVCLLQDERKTLNWNGCSFDLIGIACTHKPFIDAPKLDTLRSRSAQVFSILLYHSPDLAPQAAKTMFDFQVSGHTHGGQIRLPIIGALYTGSLYGKRFESGRYTIGDMTLSLTRGIGLEGGAAPRVRFYCSPQVILWDISGE